MEKQYKQSDKKREYHRERKRKLLLQNRKCAVCGEQATIKVLLTQQLLCDKDYVAQLKTKYKKKEMNNQ
jgi:hypothetical protein